MIAFLVLFFILIAFATFYRLAQIKAEKLHKQALRNDFWQEILLQRASSVSVRKRLAKEFKTDVGNMNRKSRRKAAAMHEKFLQAEAQLQTGEC